jgi:Domain of unknown function (DUF4281)
VSNDTIFVTAVYWAFVGWLLLAVGMFLSSASPWRGRLLLLAGRIVPLSLAAIYTVLTPAVFNPEANGMTLQGVLAMLSSPDVMLIAWIHYLAFDLFIARWIVDDAPMRGIRPWWLLPILALTLYFGPIGLLTYFVVRGVRTLKATSLVAG